MSLRLVQFDLILMLESCARPNKVLQRTALSARQIVAFLTSGIGSQAFPIYECAAAELNRSAACVSTPTHTA